MVRECKSIMNEWYEDGKIYYDLVVRTWRVTGTDEELFTNHEDNTMTLKTVCQFAQSEKDLVFTRKSWSEDGSIDLNMCISFCSEGEGFYINDRGEFTGHHYFDINDVLATDWYVVENHPSQWYEESKNKDFQECIIELNELLECMVEVDSINRTDLWFLSELTKILLKYKQLQREVF